MTSKNISDISKASAVSVHATRRPSASATNTRSEFAHMGRWSRRLARHDMQDPVREQHPQPIT